MSIIETPATLGKADLANFVSEGVGIIFQENGEGFARYLRFRRSFYRYSFGNKIRIWMQKGDATQVGSASFWKKHNRVPKADAQPISIWSKPFYMDEQQKVNGKWEKTGSGKKVRRFRIEVVYDISDTEVIDGMEDGVDDGTGIGGFAIAPIDGDSHQVEYDRLVAWLTKQGVTVVDEDCGKDTGGYYDPTRNLIAVNTNPASTFGDSVNGRLCTLIHEAVHFVGRTSKKTQGLDVAEVLTETAAFMIAFTVGLDSSPRSLAYIAQYAFTSSRDTLSVMKSMLTEIEGWCWKIENAMLFEAPEKDDEDD